MMVALTIFAVATDAMPHDPKAQLVPCTELYVRLAQSTGGPR